MKKILPPISDYSSRNEWEAACWQKISESKELLRSLISTNERHNLVMRTAAIDGLLSGKSYRKIAEELWLSSQTISAIKKGLAENAYKSHVERSKNSKKKVVENTTSQFKKPKHKRIFRRTKYGKLYAWS